MTAATVWNLELVGGGKEHRYWAFIDPVLDPQTLVGQTMRAFNDTSPWDVGVVTAVEPVGPLSAGLTHRYILGTQGTL